MLAVAKPTLAHRRQRHEVNTRKAKRVSKVGVIDGSRLCFPLASVHSIFSCHSTK